MSFQHNLSDPFFSLDDTAPIGRAVLAHLSDAGYAVVPRNPTPEMAKVGVFVADTGAILGAWEAMIATGDIAKGKKR